MLLRTGFLGQQGFEVPPFCYGLFRYVRMDPDQMRSFREQPDPLAENYLSAQEVWDKCIFDADEAYKQMSVSFFFARVRTRKSACASDGAKLTDHRCFPLNLQGNGITEKNTERCRWAGTTHKLRFEQKPGELSGHESRRVT